MLFNIPRENAFVIVFNLVELCQRVVVQFELVRTVLTDRQSTRRIGHFINATFGHFRPPTALRVDENIALIPNLQERTFNTYKCDRSAASASPDEPSTRRWTTRQIAGTNVTPSRPTRNDADMKFRRVQSL